MTPLSAPYIGYEVEQTEEEKLHERLSWYYTQGVVYGGGSVDKFGHSLMWFRRGMETALATIGVKVSGIQKRVED